MSAGLTTRDGRVFVGQVGGNQVFYALDLETGRPLWSRELGEIWASPECDGGQLFVGNKEGAMRCLDPTDGRTLWKRDVADGIYPAPAVDDKRVYTGSWDGNYYALDRHTGQISGLIPHLDVPTTWAVVPILLPRFLRDDLVIVPNLGGRLIALDTESGQLEWEWKGIPWRICNVTAATDGQTVLASVFGNAYELPFDTRLVAIDSEIWPPIVGFTRPRRTYRAHLYGGTSLHHWVDGQPFSCMATNSAKVQKNHPRCSGD